MFSYRCLPLRKTPLWPKWMWTILPWLWLLTVSAAKAQIPGSSLKIPARKWASSGHLFRALILPLWRALYERTGKMSVIGKCEFQRKIKKKVSIINFGTKTATVQLVLRNDCYHNLCYLFCACIVRSVSCLWLCIPNFKIINILAFLQVDHIESKISNILNQEI